MAICDCVDIFFSINAILTLLDIGVSPQILSPSFFWTQQVLSEICCAFEVTQAMGMLYYASIFVVL